MHKHKLNFIFRGYLVQRNKKIIKLRQQGKSLKWLASKLGLTIRQLSRILKSADGH